MSDLTLKIKDEYIDKIIQDEKGSTIRRGGRNNDYTNLDILRLVSDKNRTLIFEKEYNWPTFEHKKFKDLTDEDAVLDGFENINELGNVLFDIYGPIEPDEIMTIFKFGKLSFPYYRPPDGDRKFAVRNSGLKGFNFDKNLITSVIYHPIHYAIEFSYYTKYENNTCNENFARFKLDKHILSYRADNITRSKYSFIKGPAQIELYDSLLSGDIKGSIDILIKYYDNLPPVKPLTLLDDTPSNNPFDIMKCVYNNRISDVNYLDIQGGLNLIEVLREFEYGIYPEYNIF